MGILDLLQDGIVFLWLGLGQAFKERVRDIQYTAENLQPNAGAEFIREVYALGEQRRPPDGAGADMVLPCDALTGFFGGPVVFILNTSSCSRERMLVAMESFGPLFTATCLLAVKLVCFQTFPVGGWQRGASFL